jgi:thiamine-monophosphate kinase
LALTLEPERIPLRDGADQTRALTDGEDYELLFAVPEDRCSALEKTWPFPDTPLSCIGRFTRGTPGSISGVPNCQFETGYDHFK